MRCTRTGWPAALATASCVLIPATSAAMPESPGTVVRIDVPHATGTQTGMAFAVHATDSGGRRTIYFLSTASLFSIHSGDRARLHLPDGARDVLHTDILTPPDHTGVAIIRVTDGANIAPFDVTFAPVSAGQSFVLWGRDASDGLCLRSGQIGAVSTRVLRADRRMTAGCLEPGAPVGHERGVFALATSTPGEGPATFLPLAAARSFILRHVPGLEERAVSTPQFQLTARDVPLPAIEVAAGDRREGLLRVPLRLESSDVAIDATARVVERRAVHLADVQIVRVEDHAVTLRFSVGGDPPPTGSAPWPVGRALVVLRVNLLSQLTP